MAGVDTRAGIESLLQSMLNSSTAVEWDDWLPLAGLAFANPTDWIVSVQSLTADQQYKLLEYLRREDSGPFADALLILTARNAQEIEDSQVRDYLLADASDAADRRVALMSEQRQRVQQLVGTMDARQSEQFDIAEEMGRLERRLNELRRDEIDTEYERVHALEREILRLETLQGSLMTYDGAARAAVRDGLAQETEVLKQQRDRLEQEVATAIGERDVSQRAAGTAAEQLSALQAETEQLRTAAAQAAARTATITTEVNQLRRASVEQSHQLAQLEREHTELQERTEQDARRVTELRDAVGSRGLGALEETLSRVWPLLPADQAEKQFRN